MLLEKALTTSGQFRECGKLKAFEACSAATTSPPSAPLFSTRCISQCTRQSSFRSRPGLGGTRETSNFTLLLQASQAFRVTSLQILSGWSELGCRQKSFAALAKLTTIKSTQRICSERCTKLANAREFWLYTKVFRPP